MKLRIWKLMLAVIFMSVACVQLAFAQGFRIYNNDGTVLQFSLRTDSIVFYDGIGSEQDLGLFTPVNHLIAGTWKSGNKSVTFNEDGTTDYYYGSDEWVGATYDFFPFQGNVIIYSSKSERCILLHVVKLTRDTMIMGTTGGTDKFYFYTRTKPE